ncbi:MAG: chemotaxis protein CheD [Firmicutes bacterium]|nr:chemotaxis protein CheD [Bacillota bacterium]
MEEIIKVGMAELKVAKALGKIAALGLGSCVAICVYDSVVKVGGIAHVMLPHSSMAVDDPNRAKFGDTALPFLLEEMEKMGAASSRLDVKLVGGAEMFAYEGKTERLKIGERNLQVIEASCQKAGLKISGRCVGGNCGRSVFMNLENGEVQVKTIKGTVTMSII